MDSYYLKAPFTDLTWDSDAFRRFYSDRFKTLFDVPENPFSSTEAKACFKFVKSINVPNSGSFQSGLVEDIYMILSELCPNVERLSHDGIMSPASSHFFAPTSVKKRPSWFPYTFPDEYFQFPKLKHLQIGNLMCFLPVGLMRNLESLDLYCPQRSPLFGDAPNPLSIQISSATKLKILKLNFVVDIEKLKELEEVSFSFAKQMVSWKVFQGFTGGKLTRLFLYCNAAPPSIAHLTSLENVKLSMNSISYSSLEIEKLPRLRSVHFKTLLSTDIETVIRFLPPIDDLIIDNIEFPGIRPNHKHEQKDLLILLNLKTVRSLDLTLGYEEIPKDLSLHSFSFDRLSLFFSYPNDDDPKYLLQFYHRIEEIILNVDKKRLKGLHLENAVISDEFFRTLEDFSNLEDLTLERFYNIYSLNDNLLKHFNKLKKLKRLEMSSMTWWSDLPEEMKPPGSFSPKAFLETVKLLPDLEIVRLSKLINFEESGYKSKFVEEMKKSVRDVLVL